MTAEAPATARLSLRGHAARPAMLDVEHRAPRTRATRAILALLGFWMLAPIVFLVPPHLPWALAALVAGIVFAHRQWTGEYIVRRFEGACPRCGAALPLPAGSRVRLPHPMVCYRCHHEPVLEVQ